VGSLSYIRRLHIFSKNSLRTLSGENIVHKTQIHRIIFWEFGCCEAQSMLSNLFADKKKPCSLTFYCVCKLLRFPLTLFSDFPRWDPRSRRQLRRWVWCRACLPFFRTRTDRFTLSSSNQQAATNWFSIKTLTRKPDTTTHPIHYTLHSPNIFE